MPTSPPNIRILLVEDCLADSELIVAQLRSGGFTVDWRRVETEEQFLASLRDPPDLILSDWALQGFSGLRALELCMASGLACPFIVVSGSIGEEAAIDLLHCGATDYVLKDHLGRLLPVVERALAESRARAAQERLAAAMRLQSAALAAAGNGIVITDRDGAIRWTNPAFSKLSGYALEEAVGRNPRELLKSGVHTPAFYKDLWDTILDGRAWEGEMVNRRKDGSLYTEEMSVTPVRDADGEISHFVAIKHDVTARKQAEAAHDALEAQLMQSHKMESIGRLAGGVAHDFNNMLAVITGYTELAMRKIGREHVAYAHLEAVRGAALRSAGLTRHLLAFARRQPFAPTVLRVGEAVKQMLRVLGNVLGEHVRVETSAASDLWPVFADPTQLDQVIANLSVNARDAMEGRDGRLVIETTNVSFDATKVLPQAGVTPGDYVCLSVRDNGHGMDAATKARIFEPFFTTKPVGAGTGLGLSTVYGIVAQNGGFCDVESTPGVGTTFRIYFPRYHPERHEGVARPTTNSGHPPGGDETIMLVENELSVREVARELLSQLGYTVIAASSGPEALAAAEAHTHRISLLLTDVIMPGMNGAQLSELFAARHQAVKVLFMSGYPADVVERQGVLRADVHYLQKPFSLESLAAAVRGALDG